MNILIKLTCLVGLVIAPILGSGQEDKTADASCNKKEVCCKNKKACATADLSKIDASKETADHSHE
jgi:hypothetical protein